MYIYIYIYNCSYYILLYITPMRVLLQQTTVCHTDATHSRSSDLKLTDEGWLESPNCTTRYTSCVTSLQKYVFTKHKSLSAVWTTS